MEHDEQERAIRIADAVIDLPPEQRAAALDLLCGEPSHEIRAEVERLLENDPRLENRLAELTSDPSTREPQSIDPSSPTSAPPGPGADSIPPVIGRYHLRERLGSGGMGEVYLAEQKTPVRRIVAIKLIKKGFDSHEVVARFEAERQTLARLDHPGIARVFDAGITSAGRPYFVMEYVPGVSITTFADDNRLGLRERLELFREVCAAVAHAHTRGVIHRDLKPGNVLAWKQDGQARIKIIDFGVAKALTDDRLSSGTFFTEAGAVIGTYEYMSPEQAGSLPDVDTRSDVYSLGVLLYELLTGMRPFDRSDLARHADDELRRVIREVEPPRPSTRVAALRSLATNDAQSQTAQIAASRRIESQELVRALERELEWIPLMAMRKERDRRYPSVTDVAADVHCYLEGRPLQAGPESKVYRMKKYVGRHRGAVAALVTITVLLLAGLVGGTAMAVRTRLVLDVAKVAEAKASAAADNAERQAHVAGKAAALADTRYLIQQAQLPEAIERLKQADAFGLTYDERLISHELYQASRKDWQFVRRIPIGTRPGLACTVDKSGKPHLVLFTDGHLISYPMDGHDTSSTLDLTDRPITLRATSEADGVVLVQTDKRIATLAPDPLKELVSRTFDSSIIATAVSRESSLIVQEDGTIRLINARTLEDRQTWPWSLLPTKSRPNTRTACYLSLDDRFVLVRAEGWIVIDRSNSKIFPASLPASTFAFSVALPNEIETWWSISATGGVADYVRSFNMADGARPVRTRTVPSSETKQPILLHVALDGTTSLVGEVGMARLGRREDPTLETYLYSSLWPIVSDKPRFLALDSRADALALSTRDGVLIFNRYSSSGQGWNMVNGCFAATRTGVIAFLRPDEQGLPATFEGFETATRRWRVSLPWLTSKELTLFPWGASLSSDERRVAVLAQESNGDDLVSSIYTRKIAVIYDITGPCEDQKSWKLVRQIPLDPAQGIHAFQNLVFNLSADGKTILYGSMGGLTTRFDCETGQCLGTWNFQTGCELSPDGQLVAGMQAKSQNLIIYRVHDGTAVATLPAEGYAGGCFSADNRLFITSLANKSVVGFDVTTGNKLWSHDSDLVPHAWSIAHGRFIGFQQESGTGGLFVLGDAADCRPLAIINRTGNLHGKVGFATIGDAMYVQASRFRVDIIRPLPAEDLMTAIQTPGQPILGVAPPAPLIAAITPTTRPTVVIDASDNEMIGQNVGKVITVEGIVGKVSLTLKKNAANIEFQDKSETALLVWVPPATFTLLSTAGTSVNESLIGKKVRVRGVLGQYGGRNPEWAKRRQLTLSTSQDLQAIP